MEMMMRRWLGLAMAMVFVSGCASGNGAKYRAEYEDLKAAVLSATDARTEAKALREFGLWFRNSPYGYTLSTPSQPNINGVDLAKLQPDEPVKLRLYARSDFEPRGGGFKFVPRDKMNLILLEGPSAGEGR
jgi:hypothetical protein